MAYAILVPMEKESLEPYSILSATDYLQKLVGSGLVNTEQTAALDNFFKERQVLSEQHVQAYLQANLNYRGRKRAASED